MDAIEEKQRLAEGEAALAALASNPPPYVDADKPVTTTVTLDDSHLESLSAPPQVPAWIIRLPLTLPLLHVVSSIPAALVGARSLSEAVILASFIAFVLVSAAVTGIARSTRHSSIEVRALAARHLAAAAAVTILWPLATLLVLGPAIHRAQHCARMHHLRPMKGIMPARPFHVGAQASEMPAQVAAAIPDAEAIIFSSKGSRVLIGSDWAIRAAKQALQQAKEGAGRVVVSSKGVKALGAAEQAQAEAKQVIENALAQMDAGGKAAILQSKHDGVNHAVVSSKGVKGLVAGDVTALAGAVSLDEQL